MLIRKNKAKFIFVKKLLRKKYEKAIDDDVVIPSFPIKISDVMVDINLGDNLEFCTFTGITFDILMGLIYLINDLTTYVPH